MMEEVGDGCGGYEEGWEDEGGGYVGVGGGEYERWDEG